MNEFNRMNDWIQAISQLKLPPLQKGQHDTAAAGLCAMELVAFMERLPHSDAPACTCPVIAAYVRVVNDSLPDNKRDLLLPYLPRLVGTVSPAHELVRAEYLAWQAVRVFAPAALRGAGFIELAEKLRACTDLLGATEAARAAAGGVWTAAGAAGAAEAAAGAAAGAGVAEDSSWLPAFQALDGVLAIGPSAQTFTSLSVLPDLAALARPVTPELKQL